MLLRIVEEHYPIPLTLIKMLRELFLFTISSYQNGARLCQF